MFGIRKNQTLTEVMAFIAVVLWLVILRNLLKAPSVQDFALLVLTGVLILIALAVCYDEHLKTTFEGEIKEIETQKRRGKVLTFKLKGSAYGFYVSGFSPRARAMRRALRTLQPGDKICFQCYISSGVLTSIKKITKSQFYRSR